MDAFYQGLRTQTRVVRALVMREIITRYGRENIGILWFFAEPLLFILGITLLWTFTGERHISSGTVAEFALVSYPTVLLWRNAVGRVVKAIEVNKPLLHHRPIRPIDFFYARIILEFSSVTATFILLFLAFFVTGISHEPADLLSMLAGWFLVAWFSFGFVMTMAALSEISEVIEKISHVIAYFMLPVCGAFIPTYLVPEPLRDYLLMFPLVHCVEYFRHGYYGEGMKTYYNLDYAISANLFLTFFSMALVNYAIKKVEV
jgi:capsular polysaccharide transport system permease protein